MKKIFRCSSLFLLIALSAQSQFLPTNVPGLKLWLSADSGVTYNASKVVSQWADRSGNSNDASQVNVSQQPHFIDSICPINNMPAVRFDGAPPSGDDYMTFPRMTDIRDCFFVIKHRTGTQSAAPVLGDGSAYNFIGGDNAWLFDPAYTSAGILGGTVRLNEVDVGPVFATKPIQFSILSIYPTGNLTANYITNDRNTPSRYWDGDYAEIIIYNTSLTNTERLQIEAYLHNKYFTSCITATEEINKYNTFNIYPNPLSSSSTLQFNTQLKDAEVVIYDMLGKEMLRKKFTGNRMEIERGSLESGVYFVRVRSEERQWVEKVVVE